MTFELFYFDSVRDELIINNAIVLEIGPLKVVWDRKSKMKGDEDGKKKMLNKKELMYIFFMADWTRKNPYRAGSEKQKDVDAREACEFPKGWEPDEVVKEAIELYKNMTLNSTPTLKFLVQLEQVILQTAEQLEIIKEQNEVFLLALKDRNNSLEDALAAKDTMMALRQNLNMMFAMTDDVEKANRKRKDLEKQLKDEMEGSLKITGGRKLSNKELKFKK